MAQLDDHQRKCGRGSAQAEAAGRQEYSDGRKQRTGAHVDRERSGGRIRAARLSAGAGERQAAVPGGQTGEPDAD